jgi:hypothetical protein
MDLEYPRQIGHLSVSTAPGTELNSTVLMM